ncbi:hypothetical protein Cgig2_013234 [Carnegiea gigantea]|uniref:Uncharacterized protein n=1 Tax=Carnegiea gigantea TaxID=171969 RepID=A0A9Q1GNB5_9CARY|nr:hypothetical protein Cgig2_013234 [Carnegiea gigantea]
MTLKFPGSPPTMRNGKAISNVGGRATNLMLLLMMPSPKASLDSTAQTGGINASNWQEEVYQKSLDKGLTCMLYLRSIVSDTAEFLMMDSSYERTSHVEPLPMDGGDWPAQLPQMDLNYETPSRAEPPLPTSRDIEDVAKKVRTEKWGKSKKEKRRENSILSTKAPPKDKTADSTPGKMVWGNSGETSTAEKFASNRKTNIELADSDRNFRPTQLLDGKAPKPSTSAQI